MNKTTLNCTTRNIQPKVDDKLLSENIYRNLHVLGYIYDYTEDFKRVFVQDMFLKSNVKAFPFTMHYLFNIIDPVEFKKRFYWPIMDKSSEAQFRTSTISFLNYLREKFNLSFGPVKAHIAVLPGGVQFMKIILILTNFVMKEYIKKNKKTQTVDLKKNTTVDVKNEMDITLKNIKHLTTVGVKYKEYLLKSSEQLKQLTLQLDKDMEKLFKNCSFESITITDILTNNFLNGWHQWLNERLKTDLMPVLQHISEFDRKSSVLSESVIKIIQGKQNVEYNTDQLMESISFIKNLFPEHQYILSHIIHNNQINVFYLYQILEAILPIIGDIVKKFEYRSFDSIQYECENVNGILYRVCQTERKSHVLQNLLQDLMLHEITSKSTITSPPQHGKEAVHDAVSPSTAPSSSSSMLLKNKIMFTPQLTFDLNEIKNSTNVPTRFRIINENFHQTTVPHNKQQLSVIKSKQLINNNNNYQDQYLIPPPIIGYPTTCKKMIKPSDALAALSTLRKNMASKKFTDINNSPESLLCNRKLHFQTPNVRKHSNNEFTDDFSTKKRINSLVPLKKDKLQLLEVSLSPTGRFESGIKYDEYERYSKLTEYNEKNDMNGNNNGKENNEKNEQDNFAVVVTDSSTQIIQENINICKLNGTSNNGFSGVKNLEVALFSDENETSLLSTSKTILSDII